MLAAGDHLKLHRGGILVAGAQHLDAVFARQQRNIGDAATVSCRSERGLVGRQIGEEPQQPLVDLRAIGTLDGAKSVQFRAGRWGRGGDHFQRLAKLAGIASGEKPPAGFIGNALQGGGVFAGQIKANDMHGQINPGFLQRAGRLAGVDRAGFQPVGNQNDGGLFLTVFQRVCCLAHRRRNRGFTTRVEAVDQGFHGCRVNRARRAQSLNIAAIAFAAMAIGHQSQITFGVPIVQKVGDHATGDFDFRHALDLPPHRA